MAGAYPGGLITLNPPTTVGAGGDFNDGGTASGIWTVDQALTLKAAGLWPASPKNKFLWLWGSNYHGQLGINSAGNYRSSPVQVGALTTWSKIAAGVTHSLSLKTDGTMWAWGRGNAGRLGDNTTIYRSSPVQIGALTTWAQIAGGGIHSMAVKTDGTMWLWGSAYKGALGSNDTTINNSSPVQVGALTTWAKVAAVANSSFAIKTDGTLWAWGHNNFGQLGDNTEIDKASPIQVGALTTWAQIGRNSGNGKFAMAIKTDGTLWLWGRNNYGQLGDNTTINRSSPVQIGALTTWSKFYGGTSFTMAIKTDGTLWTFGYNGYGQLGDNTVIRRSSPVQVGALTTWSSIAGGSHNSVAVKTDGTLWTWGNGQRGQLADNTDGTTITKSSPVQVGALTTWAQVAAGPEFVLAIAAV